MRKRTGIAIGAIVCLIVLALISFLLIFATPIGQNIFHNQLNWNQSNSQDYAININDNLDNDDLPSGTENDTSSSINNVTIDDNLNDNETDGGAINESLNNDTNEQDNSNGANSASNNRKETTSSADTDDILPKETSKVVESIAVDCTSIAKNPQIFDENIGNPVKGILEGDTDYYAPFAVVQEALNNATITDTKWMIAQKTGNVDRYVYRIDAVTKTGTEFSAKYTISFDTKTGKITAFEGHLS